VSVEERWCRGMYITCEEYYTKYLGDWCDNKCDECFAEKTIYINNRDLYLPSEFIAGTEIKVEKGTLWRELFRNDFDKHIVLKNQNGKSWYISYKLFNECFEE
jgi:hypothetical protein